jgi:hypothetical protein
VHPTVSARFPFGGDDEWYSDGFWLLEVGVTVPLN